MSTPSTPSTYPADWPAIAQRAKDRAGWLCERCGAAHNKRTAHVLTVHHLDRDRANCQPWNLAVLCQRCHLSVQNRVVLDQGYLFSVAPWLQRHLDARDGRPAVLRFNGDCCRPALPSDEGPGRGRGES